MFTRIVLFLFALSMTLTAVPLDVGTARIDITPTEPIRLNGYGNRSQPSEGVEQKLWAKALAIGQDQPAILITADLIGVPSWLTDRIANALQKSHGIAPASVAICATHTHTGPTVKGVLEDIFMAPIPEDHRAAIDRYAIQLEKKLIQLAHTALNNRQAGNLAWGIGKAEFAINRRILKNGKWTGFGENPDGPVDHSLPLMRITNANGKILALLVNYACHCTTLGGNFNRIHGDWAGEAAVRIEQNHPGINAMIAIGCGADANPKARGTFDSIPIHGQTIADEVERLLETKLTAITALPKTTQNAIDLPLDPLPSKADWQKLADAKQRFSYYGQKMLKQIAAGKKLQQSISYPISTWQFGDQLAMVFLPGEVVVDYSIRLKELFDADRLWINAYANDIPSYLASRRLYDEDGYEVDRSMWYYGKPVRLSKDTEELVLDEVTRQLPHSYYAPTTLRQMPAPVSKQKALGTIRVRPGMQVELAAAEPFVMDPVDVAWGPDGRMWVVEMADYPNGLDDRGLAGGRVRFLEDTNGDGQYDRSTLFLEELNFPSSVMPWKDGILVTAAPDILFAQDTTGDGQADKIEKLFTGFLEGNQQHRVNGLQWGLDNWIHSANGDSNGKIRSHQTGKIVDISNMDFRFHPDTGGFERLSGRTQYGRNRDDVGNWFGSNNSLPGWHYALPDHYARRNPHVTYPNAKAYLQTPYSAGPVYPASRTLNRLNDYTKVNRFTSACGLTIYRDSLLGTAFAGNSFICEPVHNLVRRETISAKGATFQSRQPADEKGTEFFASTDNWSRPTSVRTGPDGALYVVDMYRFLIEHPQWVPADWQRKLNLREGHDKGRIYRIYPKGKKPRPVPDLTTLATTELVAALDSPNGIQRDLVQMALLWRNDRTAVKHLHPLFWNSRNGFARMHALCTLDAFAALTPALLEDALVDPSPAVRRHAIRLSEPLLPSAPSLLARMTRLTGDSDIGVRQQLAFSLGQSDSSAAATLLGKLAQTANDAPYLASAILSSANRRTSGILNQANPEQLSSQLATGLLQTALANNDDSSVQKLIAAGLGNRLVATLDTVRRRTGALTKYARLFKPRFDSAIRTLSDPSKPDGDRIEAIRILGRAPRSLAQPDNNLWPQLELVRNSSAVKIATLDALTRSADGNFAERLLKHWQNFGPSVRSATLQTLLKRTNWTEAMLRHLQRHPVMARIVPPAQRIQLTAHRTKSLRDLANQVFGEQTNADREKVIEGFQPALKLSGNSQQGQILFGTACVVCHKIGETGNAVGPDLTALTDRSPAAMLVAILDPNRAVEDKFISYTAALKGDEEYTGLIVEETSSGIKLADATGVQHALSRARLTSLSSSGLSLMPEGFESAFTHQAMADLLAYVGSVGGATTVKADANGEFHLVPHLAHSEKGSAPFDPAQDAFVGMSDQDAVAWTIENLPAGTYDIMANASLNADQSGKSFHLTIGDTQADGTIETTRALNRYRARKFGNIRILKAAKEVKAVFHHDLPGPYVSIQELVLIPAR
jgi:putative membrane-bound dehydrogenase-like protein